MHVELFRGRFLDRDPATVLVVRLDGLGDFILWLECAKSHSAMLPETSLQNFNCSKFRIQRIAELSLLFDKIIAIDRDGSAPTSRRGILAVS
jgi:hypothetical protein